MPTAPQRTRRAERAAERAGIEEQLRALQAENVGLMRQMKLVLAQEGSLKRSASSRTEVRVLRCSG